MKRLRTPDERFADLADYPWEPNYTEIDDGDGGTLRIHHVDAAPADSPVVLCMHGQPTWSYLYRKMIPILVADGAPSLTTIPSPAAWTPSSSSASREPKASPTV